MAAEPVSPTWAEKLPFRLTGEAEVGGQIVQPRGNSPTFDEYRDLDRTDHGGQGHIPVVPYLHLLGEDKARTKFVEIGGTNLSRMDANYYLNAGQYNYWKLNFEFDRIQHVIGHTAQTIYDEFSPGIFTIPGGAVGSGLAGPLNAAANPSTPAQRAAVVAAVNALEHGTGLGYQTDTARFGFNWLPLPELNLSVGYSFTDRDGTFPFGTVIGSPGSNAVELAAPRRDRFHEVNAGAEYARDWFQLRFNYTFSKYEDDISKVEWDNPCGAPAGGCANPSGLGRSSTPPDNFAHSFSGAGGVTLPWWRTRLAGGVSYSMWQQNDAFLPYTTIAGSTGNTDDLGNSSPNARINVINSNVNLTTHPLRNVTSTTRYRYFELENRTPVHTFTDVLSPGDTTPSPAVHETEPLAYRKQNASQELAWRIIPQVTAKAIYEYEHWNRKDREVASSNEHTVRGVVDVRPLSWILARFSYSHGVRTIGAGGYDPLGGNAVSLPQFRKFDEADRTRDKGDFLLQVSPLDTLTLSGSFFAQQDNYFNTTFGGLQDAKAFGWSGDVAWTPIERVSVSVGYARDEYQSREQSCAVSAAPPAQCNPQDIFFVRPRDYLDTVQAGLDLVVVPKRLDLGFGYRFAFGRSRQSVAEVTGGAATGDPAPVPTTQNKFHVFNVVARYFLTPQWTLKLGYQYERYEEKDFTTDGIGPALAGSSNAVLAAADTRTIILGSQHNPYEAHIVAFLVGYKF
ncbi:MAG TPA: MtrB/PioB family decaheme-associated outer membrane protein [Candidatus Methylomirabilis sp.]|nr:MtrB/PioB family decaheme-associated outer membrane protein [Candidatus Methylomirabilis sp.]